jgi:polygalacturonase
MISGQYVNALDHGADPTGASDSTLAIQSAINIAAGRTVYVP